jgi:amidohydrolase
MESQLLEKLIQIRRLIHQNPELGYREFKTAALVSQELDELGIEYQKEVAKTGIIATLQKGEGGIIALRADMDALPMQEETDLTFKSLADDAMHSCGHDVHTAMLIGAAHLLKERDFDGTVKFIFQPSEEGVYDDPDKKSGGQRICESGVLEGAKAALGLHVHPLLPIGHIAYKLGNALACTGFFKITVRGKAGHAGAAHHLSVDAIYIASSLIQTAQSLVSRYTPAVEPLVISFTKITGGTAPNVIADLVQIEGTIRALDKDTYDNAKEKLVDILKGVAETFGANIEIEYSLDYPSLINDPKIHSALLFPLYKIFGQDKVHEIGPLLGGEDFAFYSRTVPSMFYFIGTNNGSNKFFVHHPEVVFDEACISFGSEFLAEAAVSLLNSPNSK